MCTIFVVVTGAEFIRRVRRLGRERRVDVRFQPRRGKGSHGTLNYGARFTIVKDRKQEIGPGLLRKMLRDLRLTRDEVD